MAHLPDMVAIAFAEQYRQRGMRQRGREGEKQVSVPALDQATMRLAQKSPPSARP